MSDEKIDAGFNEFELDEFKPDVAESALGEVTHWATRQLELEEKVAALEEELTSVKKELADVSGVKLPDAMESANMQSFTLTNGTKVSIDTVYSGRIGKTEEEQMKAFKWLSDNNHDDMIKNVVSVQFAKGEEGKAQDLMEELKTKSQMSTNKKWVEPMTLKAFIKEQVQKGQPIPFDVFNIYVGRKTKMKRTQ